MVKYVSSWRSLNKYLIVKLKNYEKKKIIPTKLSNDQISLEGQSGMKEWTKLNLELIFAEDGMIRIWILNYLIRET